MIETAMIAAAGFLAATLLSLLIIPAVNRRAERLARRRVEALFPLSITELTAEKDHLRAEFAVLQRRLERRSAESVRLGRKPIDGHERLSFPPNAPRSDAWLNHRAPGKRRAHAVKGSESDGCFVICCIRSSILLCHMCGSRGLSEQVGLCLTKRWTVSDLR